MCYTNDNIQICHLIIARFTANHKKQVVIISIKFGI